MDTSSNIDTGVSAHLLADSPFDMLNSVDGHASSSSSSPEATNTKAQSDMPRSRRSKDMGEFCDQNCETNCESPCEDWNSDSKFKTNPQLSSLDMDSLNPTTTSDGRPRKHIRRACLECRKRHVRCDGVLPVCKKCADNNRECNYVPSHRGGVRIPRKKLQQQQQQQQQQELQQVVPVKQVEKPSKSEKISKEAPPCMMASPCMIPISTSTDIHHTPYNTSTPSGLSQSSMSDFASMLPFQQNQENTHEIQEVINGVVALSPYNSSNHTSSLLSSPENSFPHSSSSYSYDSYIPTPNSDFSSSELSTDEIINVYYSSFHHRHPILPSKDRITGYLGLIKGDELIKVMGFAAHILSSPGPLHVDDLFQRIQVVKTAIDKAPEDLAKVQASVLLSIMAHLCTDNATSIQLRSWCFDMCYRVLSAYSLSSPASDVAFPQESSIPIDVLSSWRTTQIDKTLFAELVSRVIHEIFFIDIMFAVITRGKLSPFVQSNLIDSVPVKDIPGFAYRCRFRTMKVVRSIMSSLAAMGSAIQISLEFTRLEALVTTFQGFMSEQVGELPQGFPPLLDDFGNIDDGIHQSIMMLNFSAILLHFPFSSLYQNKLPSYVQCTDDSAPLVSVQKAPLSKMRTVVSTRQCIQAANNIIKIVTDIGSSNTPTRTPLYSCSLAMAMLVHMKAYHWLTRPGVNGGPKMDENQRKQEVGLYEAYVKLESNSLQMFGSKWILASKLNTSLCNVMFNVLPELYENVIETEIRPKRKAEDPLVERDCWMKNLQFDENATLNKHTLDIFDQLFDLDNLPN